MSGCYHNLLCIDNEIKNMGDYSLAKLKKLKDNKMLDMIFYRYNIIELLRLDFYNFKAIIESPDYKYRPMYFRMMANESDFVSAFLSFGYILSLYMGNIDASKSFTLFFKECAKIFGEKKYDSINTQELEIFLSRYLNFNKTKVETNETPNLDAIKKTIYYEEYNKFRVLDYKLSYDMNYSDMKDRNYVKLSSKHNEYGYDILSYDLYDQKEKLISVKLNEFELNESEYKTISKVSALSNCDYYIYLYCHNKEDKNFYIKMLKLDKERQIFVDQHDLEYSLESLINKSKTKKLTLK